jgi:hypothetical protein
MKGGNMCVIFNYQHIGIILTIIGTVCLAFSVKTETQYTADKFMEDCLERARKDGKFVPTYTYIDKKVFYIGLACVGIGSLMQW